MSERNYPLVYAHRGACGYAPENTMASFRKAMEQGADGFELDVQMTKDGEVVVVHDEYLERVSDGKGFVKDYTLEQLRKMNFNRQFPEYGFQQIPTLKEVLDLLKPTDLGLNIELKTNVFHYDGIIDKVFTLVEESGMKDRIIYSSFNHETCVEIRNRQKDAYVGFLYADGFLDVEEYVKNHGGNALHPAFYLLQDMRSVRKARQLGLDINAWVINEPEHLEMACQRKLNIIITNYPDRALNIVKKYK